MIMKSSSSASSSISSTHRFHLLDLQGCVLEVEREEEEQEATVFFLLDFAGSFNPIPFNEVVIADW